MLTGGLPGSPPGQWVWLKGRPGIHWGEWSGGDGLTKLR